MNKIDKKLLIHQPIVFVEKQYHKTKRVGLIYKRLFNYFNVLSMIAAFVITTLSTIVFSKVWFSSVPSWYFYSTTFVTALITFITSIINFFYIKQKYLDAVRNHELIKSEIMKYSEKIGHYKAAKNRDFEIFHRVNLILGNQLAKEVEDERN